MFFKAKKMTYAVNTVILLLVFGLMAFFHMVDAPFLTYFSIPTAGVYVLGYYLIHKERLDAYVWMVYLWLTFYMGISTVFLGYAYGFHLYCFSMIPVMFVTEYLSIRINREGEKQKSLKARPVSLFIALFYLICTGYVAYFGPIYVREQSYAALFWISNALIVFGFLIFYTDYMLRMVVQSEDKLRDMAQVDRLTGLYNRHYVINRLENLPEEAQGFLAMADIDNFKKINDTYGHNAGDAILRAIADKMRELCTGCELARWGGEEFLIFVVSVAGSGNDAEKASVKDGVDLMERLRKKIEAEPITFDDQWINVTITVGVEERKRGCSIDEWVQEADKKLYLGKTTGKNKVIA